MQLFSYRVKDINGNVQEGTIEAEEIMAAASKLRQHNLYITKLEPKGICVKAAPNNLVKSYSFRRKVKTQDLAIFCRQLSILLNAGVPILNALNLLSVQITNKQFNAAVIGVAEKLKTGYTLAGSLKCYPNVFPNIFISMVQAGEQSGALHNTLMSTADYFEREQEIKEKLKTALIYPMIILALAIIMVAFVLIFVLPRYVRVLNIFNLELPFITQVLLNVSNLIINFWYVIVFIIIGSMYSFSVIKKTKRFKEITDKLLLRLPVLGKIYNKVLIARFSRTLAVLICSGIPLLQALTLVKNVADNVLVTKAIEDAQTNLQYGRTLTESLGKSSIFPKTVIQMIGIGEQSGKVEQLLEKVAEVYEQDINTTVARISPILEPLLLVVTSIFIGLIVIAVMLPIFRILGTTVNY